MSNIWNVTKMTTRQWCELVDAQAHEGPLARMAAAYRLPAGVDPNDPEVVSRVWRCIYKTALPPQGPLAPEASSLASTAMVKRGT